MMSWRPVKKEGMQVFSGVLSSNGFIIIGQSERASQSVRFSEELVELKGGAVQTCTKHTPTMVQCYGAMVQT